MYPGPAVIYRDEYQRRSEHSAKCGDNWQCCRLRISQVAVYKFTFYLQPDEEEEDTHQALVDETLAVMPKIGIRGMHWRICKYQGDDA